MTESFAAAFFYKRSGFKNWIKLAKKIAFKLITSSNSCESLALFSSGYISENYMLHGNWEPEIVLFIKLAALRNELHTFIDIGANIGVSSLQVLDCFTNFVLVEPIPVCAAMSHHNLSSHPAYVEKKILVVNSAIDASNNTYLIELDKSDIGSTSLITQSLNVQSNLYTSSPEAHRKTFISTVNCDTLRNILVDYFSSLDKLSKAFVKIDVEGYEVIVLKEIVELFKDQPPSYFVIEVHDLDTLKQCREILSKYALYQQFSFEYNSRGSKVNNIKSLVRGSKVRVLDKFPKKFPADVIFEII